MCKIPKKKNQIASTSLTTGEYGQYFHARNAHLLPTHVFQFVYTKALLLYTM